MLGLGIAKNGLAQIRINGGDSDSYAPAYNIFPPIP